MSRKSRKDLGILTCIVFMTGAVVLSTRAGQADPNAGDDPATREKIARYVRERFAILDTVKMTVWSLREFTNPNFYKTNITVDDGKEKRTQDVFLSKDRRYLIVANVYSLGVDPQSEIAQRVREVSKLAPATNVTAGPFRNSPFPHLLATTITVDDGKQKASQDVYVTEDNRFLFLGNVYDMSVDPRGVALRTISTENQPSQGPISAPVTIVEYSDLQCRSCAFLHEFLESQLVPKYGGKIRVVFKEFPIPSIHDWSLTAALANQCVYQTDPGAFLAFRSLIFKNQGNLNAANVRDRLLEYGEQVGVDRIRLAACIDAKTTLPRVEASLREGQALGVVSTPTSFINGRMMVGLPAAEAVYRIVDEALRAAR